MNLPDVYESSSGPKSSGFLRKMVRTSCDLYRWTSSPGAGRKVGNVYRRFGWSWEGDTLVFQTVALKGSRDGDSILDRTGAVLSDAAQATTACEGS